MAERQGFEPWVPVKAQRFSRPPRSTTPAPLRAGLACRPQGAVVIGSGQTNQEHTTSAAAEKHAEIRL